MRVCVIPGVIKAPIIIQPGSNHCTALSAEFAQACDFKFATLQWFTPVPGLTVTTEVWPYHIREVAEVWPYHIREVAEA